MCFVKPPFDNQHHYPEEILQEISKQHNCYWFSDKQRAICIYQESRGKALQISSWVQECDWKGCPAQWRGCQLPAHDGNKVWHVSLTDLNCDKSILKGRGALMPTSLSLTVQTGASKVLVLKSFWNPLRVSKPLNTIMQLVLDTNIAARPLKCSGHGAMKENFYLDDGTYSASQIVIELVRRRMEGKGDITEELLKKLKEPEDSQEFRLKLKVNPARTQLHSGVLLFADLQDLLCSIDHTFDLWFNQVDNSLFRGYAMGCALHSNPPTLNDLYLTSYNKSILWSNATSSLHHRLLWKLLTCDQNLILYILDDCSSINCLNCSKRVLRKMDRKSSSSFTNGFKMGQVVLMGGYWKQKIMRAGGYPSMRAMASKAGCFCELACMTHYLFST